MKRSILGVLFALVLLVGLLAVTVGATEESETETTHADHCVCGGHALGMTNHSCDSNITWQAWTDGSKLPTTPGNYYLDVDVSFSATKETSAVGETVNLCLNGHTVSITGGRINVKGNLRITDCGNTGKIVSTASGKYGGIFYVYNGAYVTIYAGTYDASGTSMRNGGVAHIGNDQAAYMDIYGGTLIGGELTVASTVTDSPRGTKGGILDITVSSVVNMYGGTLQGGTATETSETTDSKNWPMGGCIAVYSGTFNMYGGTISGGTATYGGCIFVRTGAANIYGGTVSGGTADYGGNIYSTTALTLSGGTISGGTSTLSYGGNVYGEKAVTVSGATLTGGLTPSGKNGGSIYTKTTFTMTGFHYRWPHRFYQLR